MTSANTSPDSPSKLKRLGFVQNGASYVYSYTVTADGIYKRVRSAVPTSLTPTLEKAESTVATYAAPLVARAQDAAEWALHTADDQVDYVVTTADKTAQAGRNTVSSGLSSVRQIHESNVKTFTETSKAYYDWVQQIADWAKDHLNPVKGGQAALDALNAAIARAQEAADPDVAAKIATDAWTRFASVPLVAKVLETADPVTKTALSSFTKLHDSLVSASLYKRAYETGVSTLTWASTTSPYRIGATYLYPWVQPVADPALNKLASSKVIQDTLGYWKPTALAA